VSVVDDATHTQKDDVESNGGSLEYVAEISVLFFCGVQLVLRSGVLTMLDLDEVDVTPRSAEVFRSVLSGVGGSTGGWRCCWGAPSQLPPATLKNPPPYISLICVFAAMGVTSIKSGRLEVNLSLSEKRAGNFEKEEEQVSEQDWQAGCLNTRDQYRLAGCYNTMSSSPQQEIYKPHATSKAVPKNV